MFSKKATKIDEIFAVDLTLCSKRQNDGEDWISSIFVAFLKNMNFIQIQCTLLNRLYIIRVVSGLELGI